MNFETKKEVCGYYDKVLSSLGILCTHFSNIATSLSTSTVIIVLYIFYLAGGFNTLSSFTNLLMSRLQNLRKKDLGAVFHLNEHWILKYWLFQFLKCFYKNGYPRKTDRSNSLHIYIFYDYQLKFNKNFVALLYSN